MPQVDDWISSGEQMEEMFSTSIGKMDIVSREQAAKIFPDVKFTDSPNIVYFPFRLCHSLPTVNDRGRAFTPQVLQNSFGSLSDQLIDWEHSLQANGIGMDDKIIGHVKASRFDMPENMKELQPKEVASLSNPLPVIGLGALFLRAQGVQRAIDNHLKKKEHWGVSMECGHRWKDAYLLYRDEFIPIADAEIAMRDCIKPNAVSEYKGHRVAACLGGLTGKVNFWGLGITQNPADTDADILSIFAGSPKELASKNFLYFPFYAFDGKALEVASKSTDSIIHDLANMSIIGHTNPAAGRDGKDHAHAILSNLSLVPHDGHTHDLRNVHVSRGTKPTLTGHTSEHTSYSHEMGSSEAVGSEVSSGNFTHLHLVNVPLLGKAPPDSTSSMSGAASNYLDAEESSMKTLQQILDEMSGLVSKLSTANEQASRDKFTSEIASTLKEATTIMSQQSTEQSKKEFLDAEIAAGRVITKEKYDKDVADAVTAATDELKKQHDTELLSVKKKSDRLTKCTELKIDLDATFEGINGEDGKPISVRSKIESLPTDDAGDREFQFYSALLAQAVKVEEEPIAGNVADEQKRREAEAEAAKVQAAEAASKKTRVIPMAGGSAVTPEAASGTPATQPAAPAGRQQGKSSLRKRFGN